ncbi:Ig-like domain-containing protein [Parvularcula oceani]|uniref:Ig-like domain-containing protein n=1 Tax=Parvularcula oceani TaxID=1247963 RepID=UPI0005620D66|nr:Ig-like domain-containing protein [Parvularcula oceani]
MRAALIVLVLVILAAATWFGLSHFGGSEPAEAPVAERQAPAEARTEATEPGMVLPRFDIVRVARSGYAVVAGTGEPGATVSLLSSGEVLAETTIGPDGAWAINTETPLEAGPVELTLRQTPIDAEGEAVSSEEAVVIYVPETETDSPLVLRTTPGGATEILQRTTDSPRNLGPLAIEAIDYDTAGNVLFSGRASPDSMVQVLLDGIALSQPVTADGEGRWELSAQVAPGLYTLRAVQVGPDGEPEYVVEVPFERAAYDEVVQRTDGGVVVQPGNSLWVISRSVYGEGRQFTVIFEANADQIRDPDLIYPGQVFRVPGEEE